jgi:hypothetical protein
LTLGSRLLFVEAGVPVERVYRQRNSLQSSEQHWASLVQRARLGRQAFSVQPLVL